jgi:hypothetical protein
MHPWWSSRRHRPLVVCAYLKDPLCARWTKVAAPNVDGHHALEWTFSPLRRTLAPREEEVHVAIDRNRHDFARGSKRLFAMCRTVLLMLLPFRSPTSHSSNGCGKLLFSLTVNSIHLPGAPARS